MFTILSIPISQFGSLSYQAASFLYDVQKLVRFEVLSLDTPAKKKHGSKKTKVGVN